MFSIKKDLVLFLSFIISLMSCSSSNSAGGSDLPNGKVVVSVVEKNVNTTSSVVYLKSIKLTSNGETVQLEEKGITDGGGTVIFENIPEGRYVVYANQIESSNKSINSNVVINSIDSIYNLTLNNRAPVCIVGRILNHSYKTLLFVPGMNKLVEIDSTGRYYIENVPTGKFELALIKNGIVSITSLKIDESVEFDTLFVKDLDPNSELSSDIIEVDYYKTDLSALTYINAISYDMNNMPDWYKGKDFSLIEYYDVDAINELQIPIWHFPVIAGVSSQTSEFYGGFDAVKDSIKIQIGKVDSLFNIDGLSGDIRFSLDSVYLIPQHPDSEAVEPPAGFAVRILYDGFEEGTKGNWIKNRRVIVHNVLSATKGTFSDEALIDVMWEFGLFRGCPYISGTHIYASKNGVNGTSFNAPNTVMNLQSTTEWIDASISVMNYYGGTFSTVPSINLNAYPEVIGIRVLNYNNETISNVKVNVYGAAPFSDSIDNIIEMSGYTDTEGKFNFNKNPYISEDSKNHIFDNLLIEVDTGNNKYYSWMPYYLLIEWWFEHPGEAFYLQINTL